MGILEVILYGVIGGLIGSLLGLTVTRRVK
jgi:ABC-type antimicrobial peptide transport system permease subunit